MALRNVGFAHLLGVLLLLFAVPVSLRAQVLVAGRVTDERSGSAVSTAEVMLTDSLGRNAGWAITSEDGQFSITHPGPGTYELSVDRIGYIRTFVTVTLQGMVADIDFSLTVLPIELERLEVIARQRPSSRTHGFRGLDARRAAGLGDFIDREEIERRHPSEIVDLLVARPSLRRIGKPYDPFSNDVRFLGTERMGLGRQCPPTIWVDGMLVRDSPDSPLYLSDVAPPPNQIEAIELYRRASGVPVQYNINAMCGVILIWTRVR